MGLVSHDLFLENAVAYCDTCDAVLLPGHRHTPRTFHASVPAEITPLFCARDEIVAAAQNGGWVASADGRWSCDRCRWLVPPAFPDTTDADCLRNVKILIAEDHRDSREALRVYLDEFGATCIESSAGNEAFDAFVRTRPHILLADVWMPDVDGLELIHCIRSLPAEQGRLTPAIAISAQVNEEQALMAGYHAVIPKPYDPATVVEMVKELVYPGGAAPSRQAPWTLISRAPGMVAMTFAGRIGAADAKASMEALLAYLARGPCDLVVDLRGVTGFSLAGASVAQRLVWDRRHAIRHVKVIGGSRSACIVASASCRLLGLGCTVEGVEP